MKIISINSRPDSLENLSEEQTKIITEDGFPIFATIFQDSDTLEYKPVLIIAAGVGVPRYVYSKFARYMAGSGYDVITFDYRGVNDSQDEQFAPSEMKMDDWGKLDLEAVLQFAQYELKSGEIYFLGHSAGGQLLGLAPSSERIEAAVYIGVTSGHWRFWPGYRKWILFLFWYLMPLLTWNQEYLPAKKMGLSSIDIPAGATRQWAEWGRSPNYLFDHISEEDRQRYARLEMPLLSISFDDDMNLGPKKAVDKILEYLPNAELTRRHIFPDDYSKQNIGHFGFFRKGFELTLWQEVLDWLENN